MKTAEILIGLAGDVVVDRDDPAEIFRDVQDVLLAPQILFANLESPYTDQPRRPLTASAANVCPRAHNLDVFAPAGFHVMSMANNHIMDGGPEAMLETRARLRAQGIATCGAGETLQDARAPAILTIDGIRVAFLAYASMFPVGYDARTNAPGLVPMRGYNFYRELSQDAYRPGAMPLVTTVPDENDQHNLAEDIRRARDQADLVITSFHWGDHRRPFHLTDHEKKTARFCIDQGAHMVVGHHHHALRGMEWYQGKPILYGLGHFVFDCRLEFTAELKRLVSQLRADGASYELGPRAGWPLLPLHEDTRMTVLAWAKASRAGITDIGFLPCRLTADGLVHPLRLGTPESDQIVAYMEKCHDTQGLASRIVRHDPVRLAGFDTLRVIPS